MLHPKGYTTHGTISKRIGANKQARIDTRNAKVYDVLHSTVVVYTSYALMTAVVLVSGYMMFAIAVLCDASNPYN